jgi:5-methylthioadenosine/S-adenosylhomocysteine deaminase
MKELKTLREELTEKYGSEKAPIIWHTHIAETSDEKEKIRKAFNIQIRNGVMEYLDSLGVLNEKVVAAHCVALTDEDVKIMKKRSVKVSHNPISNLKLASGISPIPKMQEENITVSLGTDSPCSNNTADMFETMKITAILHKGINKNPTLLPAEKILEMATINGAKALSWDDEIGSIIVGKKADLIIINMKKPHLSPLHNEKSHMVYAAKASDVETVIINGKIIMENRTLKNLKIERVMALAEKTKNSLLRRLSANIK